MRMKQLAYAIGLIGLSTVVAHADDTTPPAKVEKIEVTGSSIKRVAKEGALPVTVLSKDDITRTGATTTEQLLSTLTATSTAGGTTSAQGVGAATYGEATVSLRGLGSNRTLVLLDGRRLSAYATPSDGSSVDVNSIPLAAVERVEILKDGASGVYGSDAIAGVINFILKKDYRGFEATGYFGTPTRNSAGQTTKGSFVLGFGDLSSDKFNLMISGDAEQDKAVYGRDRDFAKNSWDDNTFDYSATPSGRIQMGWQVGVPYNQQVLKELPSPLAPDNCTANGSTWNPVEGTCRFNSAPYAAQIPDMKRANLIGNFHYQITPDHQLYAQAVYGHSEVDTKAQASPHSSLFWNTDTAFQKLGVEPALLIQPGTPYYPGAALAAYDAAHGTHYNGQLVTTSYRAFEGGGRDHKDTSDQGRFILGVKGSFGDWDYDTAYNYTSAEFEEDTLSGYQSQTALATFLNVTAPAAGHYWNPWGMQTDPYIAQGVAATDYNGMMLKSTMTTGTFDAKVSNSSILALPAGDLAMAVGMNLRHEHLDEKSSAAAQGGDVSGYGSPIMPFENSRNISAVFAEFNAPIVKNLEATLAVREDHYGGSAGDSTNPKISLRWSPSNSFLVRASYGKGFRAPSLVELYSPQLLGNSSNIVDPGNPGAAKAQYGQLLGGNPNLKPETSEQASVGLVIAPTANFSASVDFYKIRIAKTIGTLDIGFVLTEAQKGNPLYTGLVHRAPNGALVSVDTINENIGTTDTSGLDIDLKWRSQRLPFGRISAELAGTYVSKYDVTLPDGSVQGTVGRLTDDNGNVLNALSAGGLIQRWKHDLTVSLDSGDWNTSLTQNFQSSYRDATDNNGNFNTVGAFSTWDAQTTYSGVKNLRVTLGLKNMFDRNPPTVSATGIYFQTGYDPSYYDVRGRVAYVQANYKFW